MISLQDFPCLNGPFAGTSRTKRLHQDKFAFSLFWMSQCVACSPAWWILYHVTASCKGPINHQLVFLLIHRLRSRFLSLLLSSFYVCRHIQRAIHEFIAFFKIYVCFSEKQWAMQVPAKRNAGCSTGFECLISHWLTWRGGRTYGRSAPKARGAPWVKEIGNA